MSFKLTIFLTVLCLVGSCVAFQIRDEINHAESDDELIRVANDVIELIGTLQNDTTASEVKEHLQKIIAEIRNILEDIDTATYQPYPNNTQIAITNNETAVQVATKLAAELILLSEGADRLLTSIEKEDLLVVLHDLVEIYQRSVSIIRTIDQYGIKSIKFHDADDEDEEESRAVHKWIESCAQKNLSLDTDECRAVP